MKIVGLILTYNEEKIISKCINALDFVDEIVVYDSYSTDKTTDIAKSLGAKVISKSFDNFAAQRNSALEALKNRAEWILMVDADEVITTELKKEIQKCISKKNEITLYNVRRKDFYKNKWIKHSSGYPTWFPRLFKSGKVKVKREINEEYITFGQTGYLSNHLDHYPFNKGIDWWFEKHNKYSSAEAIKMKTEMSEKINFKHLFSLNPAERRKTQKLISYRLPFRPTIIFIALFILRRGFLDGKEGYEFCKLRKIYETMIEIKQKQ